MSKPSCTFLIGSLILFVGLTSANPSAHAESCLNSVSPAQAEHYSDLLEQANEHAQAEVKSRNIGTGQVGAGAQSIANLLARSQSELTHEIKDAEDRFFTAAKMYMKSAQTAADFSGLMKHMFVDRTQADNDREAAYREMTFQVQRLKKLGLSNQDLYPFYHATVVALQSTNYDEGIKQIDSLTRVTYAAPLVVPLFMYVPALAKGFAFSMIGSVVSSMHFAADRSTNYGLKEFFCETERHEVNHLGTILQSSAISSPTGFIPWKKIPWQAWTAIGGISVSVEAYISIKKHQYQKDLNERTQKILNSDVYVAPTPDEKLKDIDQNYFQSTGQHLSQAQLERMVGML